MACSSYTRPDSLMQSYWTIAGWTNTDMSVEAEWPPPPPSTASPDADWRKRRYATQTSIKLLSREKSSPSKAGLGFYVTSHTREVGSIEKLEAKWPHGSTTFSHLQHDAWTNILPLGSKKFQFYPLSNFFKQFFFSSLKIWNMVLSFL